jgi:hypothetical protein
MEQTIIEQKTCGLGAGAAFSSLVALPNIGSLPQIYSLNTSAPLFFVSLPLLEP